MGGSVSNDEIAKLRARVDALEADVVAARQRAQTAEEQLHRVYLAVRKYKARQVKARHAAEAAQRASELEMAETTGLTDSWATADPSLDERLTDFLGSSYEHDRSRDWMLGS